MWYFKRLETTALKKNDEVVEPLADRIVGRVSLHDVYDPRTEELLVASGQMISEDIAAAIDAAPIESVEIRSALTCEAKKGVCADIYGRNLSTGNMAVSGDAVGVVAAQSIGEPGTQLTPERSTLSTASKIASESSHLAKFDGKLEIDDLRTISTKNENGEDVNVVISRTSEARIIDEKLGIVLSTNTIPYGSTLYVENGKKIKKDTLICNWDPYNAVIISEVDGKIAYNDITEGITYRIESDEQTNFKRR